MTTFEPTKILQQPNSLFYNPRKPWWHQIQDPNGEFVMKWNRIFLITSLIALFVDPLFFYLPSSDPRTEAHFCMRMDDRDVFSMMMLRTIVDIYSALHIGMKFRTAYVSRSSRVFGKGDLVVDPRLIAIRYFKTDFLIDLAAALPLPQIVLWYIMPREGTPTAAHANHSISLVIILQYIPRLFVIFPLNKQIIKNTGVVAKTAWSGAAYNLLIYLLASHVVGASWYLMAFERYYDCFKLECEAEQDRGGPCQLTYLECDLIGDLHIKREEWANTTEVFKHCNAKTTPNNYEFGMFANIDNDKVAQAFFNERWFYCLWWGLSSLSSYGQNAADTSTSVAETMFACLICLVGLVFFALLIGNMQTYLQSMTARLEEWRVKRRDTEEWMRHRQLPLDLQQRVRRFVQYKWLATRGVDEEEILQSLPMDLRRQIQRHLCLALVRRVPFFSQMDDQLLDAICERLTSSLNVKDMYVVREGDPVNEMLFIIRGQLESSTTNGGRSGFFNSITLKNGDFCGEELLTWALMPTSSLNLPLSTRTVKSLTEVEAFALRAEDLKFVANQFKRLHSKKLQHAFRYYSHQWRTWGACFIQTAWRRFKRKKLADELAKHESMYRMQLGDQESDNYDQSTGSGDEGSAAAANNAHHLTTTILASRFAANTRRGVAQKLTALDPGGSMPKKLLKPDDPDFSTDH